jgi:hypothetical protein
VGTAAADQEEASPSDPVFEYLVLPVDLPRLPNFNTQVSATAVDGSFLNYQPSASLSVTDKNTSSLSSSSVLTLSLWSGGCPNPRWGLSRSKDIAFFNGSSSNDNLLLAQSSSSSSACIDDDDGANGTLASKNGGGAAMLLHLLPAANSREGGARLTTTLLLPLPNPFTSWSRVTLIF